MPTWLSRNTRRADGTVALSPTLTITSRHDSAFTPSARVAARPGDHDGLPDSDLSASETSSHSLTTAHASRPSATARKPVAQGVLLHGVHRRPRTREPVPRDVVARQPSTDCGARETSSHAAGGSTPRAGSRRTSTGRGATTSVTTSRQLREARSDAGADVDDSAGPRSDAVAIAAATRRRRTRSRASAEPSPKRVTGAPSRIAREPLANHALAHGRLRAGHLRGTVRVCETRSHGVRKLRSERAALLGELDAPVFVGRTRLVRLAERGGCGRSVTAPPELSSTMCGARRRRSPRR